MPAQDHTDYSTTASREAYIRGLRTLASFLEAHPLIPTPTQCYRLRLNDSFTREELSAIARSVSKAKKEFYDESFQLQIPVIDSEVYDERVSITLTTEREAVCERIVVGTKLVPASTSVYETPEHEEEIIEWRCIASLLSQSEQSEE
jgi:hypothetical protein